MLSESILAEHEDFEPYARFKTDCTSGNAPASNASRCNCIVGGTSPLMNRLPSTYEPRQAYALYPTRFLAQLSARRVGAAAPHHERLLFKHRLRMKTQGRPYALSRRRRTMAIDVHVRLARPSWLRPFKFADHRRTDWHMHIAGRPDRWLSLVGHRKEKICHLSLPGVIRTEFFEC